MLEFDNLYRTLVVGGAVLVGACATTGKTAPSTGPADVPADAAASPDTPQEEGAEDLTPDAPVESEALACEEICEGGPGRDMVCPDPQLGFENCCWLMGDPHPCCP